MDKRRERTRTIKLEKRSWGLRFGGRSENQLFISHIRYGEGKKRETNLDTFECFLGGERSY